MKLNEWEIWHTYTTHLSPIKDLDAVARTLVATGVAECAIHRDGRTYWRHSSGVRAAGSTVWLRPDRSSATIRLDPDKEGHLPDGFAREVWWQAAHFRFCEMRVFGTDSALPPPYIRAFLGKSIFRSPASGREVQLYPQLKLFETGVLLLEYRVIGGEMPVDLPEFIARHVNLYQESFEVVDLSPGVVEYATHAYYYTERSDWPVHLRAGLEWLARGHATAVRQQTRRIDDGEFTFEVTSLSRYEGEEHDHTLSSVFLAIAGIVAYLASNPRRGWRLVVLGQKPVPPWGAYWSGRPQIYLTRFDGQQETATENEEAFAGEFGRIIARVPQLIGHARSYLPANARTFPDYGAYIGLGASLWAWSLSGLKNQEEHADPNRGHLIYEHQSVMEVLEYGYMIHRSLFEASAHLARPEDVILGRRQLVRLRQQMAQVSGWGEIRDLLDRGWEAYGLADMRNLIHESLTIAESATTLRETRANERLGTVLTVGFGLLAVPSVAGEVVAPLWQIQGWWTPSAEPATTLFFVGIATAAVGIISAGLIARHRGARLRQP